MCVQAEMSTRDVSNVKTFNTADCNTSRPETLDCTEPDNYPEFILLDNEDGL